MTGDCIVNQKNSPQQTLSPLRRSMTVIIALVLIGTFVYNIIGGSTPPPQESTLPDIVAAIEANQIETMTVQGDLITAQTFNGITLSAFKETNISTVEALSLLGVTQEQLKTVPIVVEEVGFTRGSFFGILLTFAPFLFLLYIFYRASRQMQGGGGGGRQQTTRCRNLPPVAAWLACRWRRRSRPWRCITKCPTRIRSMSKFGAWASQ